MIRVAVAGRADERTTRDTFAAVRARDGDFIALVAEGGDAAVRRHAATSHYYADLATHDHGRHDERRDRAMLARAALVVELAPGTALARIAHELGVPVWPDAARVTPDADDAPVAAPRATYAGIVCDEGGWPC